MANQHALDKEQRLMSLWPPLIAVGLAVSEVGVLFGLLFASIGGLLLLGISCASVISEAGYAESIWRPLEVIGGLFALTASGVWTVGALPVSSISGFLRAPGVNGVAYRGSVILAAGCLLLIIGFLGSKNVHRLIRTP